MSGSEPKAQPNGARLYDDELPPSMKIVPTIYPASPPIEETLAHFWNAGEELEHVDAAIEPPAQPLELLERLGPSPFERGQFPLVGFLATTYEKVSRFALSRRPRESTDAGDDASAAGGPR